MSASNWAWCPVCQYMGEDTPNNMGETFREDYEIYGAEDGTVMVSYHGQCGECKTKLEFKHEHVIGAKT